MAFFEYVVSQLLTATSSLVALLPDAIADPFQFGFMQRALLTASLVGIVCGVLSCFVVLKRWALLGDAISHAVLPGVALAYLFNLPFFIGAFLSGALASFGMGFIERNTRIKQDSAMGIMFTAYFALGIVIISKMATSTHLMHILFGNVLGVRLPTLTLTFWVSITTLIIIALFFKELQLYTFDSVQATALGINTSLLHYGLMLLITATIVASLETVGIILVVAMLITPGATAYLLANRLRPMLIISAATGLISAVAGLYLSFVYDIASGGTIVLVATVLFLLAMIFSPQHGLLRTKFRLASSHS